ncbi:tetratricopeptide repeat protein [Marinicella sediminis]|uniref:Tetratricopeptide repeat protein n=1 Tax=Marinicella sediminis TaxID=1792834 RepID=A0ABV7J8K0_9GAMM|nr:serine/threonine-protein kinase [Marinicella sediminis]
MNDINVTQWKQANAVYQQLMDLTVSAALDKLNGMTGLDDGIKSMVLALISSGNQSSQYLQQWATPELTAGSDQADYQADDQLGDYRLEVALGEGGMSRVFRAVRLDGERQKPVAIKVFKKSVMTPALISRFAVEQDILAELTHPNIINMHHGGTSESGSPYIVMDLIEEARDIDVYAAEHQLSRRRKLAFIITAGQAIAFAHHNLIVHRDIKPSNLLVDQQGQLKVVDFGIAKLMTRAEAPQKTTIMALTPTFAAPEQINSGQISVTTDVFSLAVVALQLLIGESPLPADRLLKSCAEDEEHVRQLLKSRIDDADLRNILNQALQQDPEKRYRNMDSFVQDLQAWMDNKPVMASPDSWWYRSKKFAQRRSALFATLVTLVVMSLLGVTLLAHQVEKTRGEALKALEVKDFMLGVFSVVNPDQSQGDRILARDLLAQAVAELKQQDFSDQATQVELLSSLGTAQSQLGLYPAAKDTFAAALKLDARAMNARLGEIDVLLTENEFAAAESRLAEVRPLLEQPAHQAEWLLLHAKMLSFNGDYAAALDEARQAVSQFAALQLHKQKLQASRQVANVLFLQSESPRAAELLQQELTSLTPLLGPTNTMVLAAQNDLVELFNDVGDYDQAIKYSESLIDNITTVLGEEHPFLVQAYITRAGTSRATGAIEEAGEFAKRALNLSQTVNGETHQATARAMNLMAVISYVRGDLENALERMREASRLFDQAMGADHPESWDVKTNLVALLNMNGQYDEAISTVKPLYETQREELGASHRSTIYSQTILARLYGDVGRLDEARLLGEDLLVNAMADLGQGHPLTIGGHFTLARIYQKQGELAAAIQLMERVINHESWQDDNERVITAYNSLADLYLEDAQSEQARLYKDKSLQAARNLLGEEAPRTVAQMLKSIAFYQHVDQPDQAVQLIDRVKQLLLENQQLPASFAEQLQALEKPQG